MEENGVKVEKKKNVLFERVFFFILIDSFFIEG